MFTQFRNTVSDADLARTAGHHGAMLELPNSDQQGGSELPHQAAQVVGSSLPSRGGAALSRINALRGSIARPVSVLSPPSDSEPAAPASMWTHSHNTMRANQNARSADSNSRADVGRHTEFVSQMRAQSQASSLSQHVVNFEDLPAGVISRQEVGVLNDFQVPSPPSKSVVGPTDTPFPSLPNAETCTVDASDPASSARGKPKMLRRGDGTRRLRDAMRGAEQKVAGELRKNPTEVMASETPRFGSSVANAEAPLNCQSSARDNSFPVVGCHAHSPSETLAAAAEAADRGFLQLPAELLGHTTSATTGASANSAAPANAIRDHLMSVFGSGLEFSPDGSPSDPEAADIITFDLSDFPTNLWKATASYVSGSTSSSFVPSSTSDIVSFVARRDAEVNAYLDVRRLDFLSSIFPSIPEEALLRSGLRPPNVARFTDGCEGFSGRRSVLRVNHYHTTVRHFEGMDE